MRIKDQDKMVEILLDLSVYEIISSELYDKLSDKNTLWRMLIKRDFDEICTNRCEVMYKQYWYKYYIHETEVDDNENLRSLLSKLFKKDELDNWRINLQLTDEILSKSLYLKNLSYTNTDLILIDSITVNNYNRKVIKSFKDLVSKFNIFLSDCNEVIIDPKDFLSNYINIDNSKEDLDEKIRLFTYNKKIHKEDYKYLLGLFK